jgi:Methane oxygenase PmoA
MRSRFLPKFLVQFWMVSFILAAIAAAEEKADPDAPLVPRKLPRMQILPLPNGQASVTRDDVELTRYHFGNQNERPFLYPLNGPSGKSLTRMGHPHDPFGHSHHNSVWMAHYDVDGVNFWGDKSNAGRIVHQRILEYEDGDRGVAIGSHNRWMIAQESKMEDYRRYQIESLENGETFLMVDIELHAPPKHSVTLGKTSFGLLSVRMAKSMGVHDGAGRIRNSEGAVNEAGVHWKPAQWCDYSGAVSDAVIEGITLLDHPGNFNHPTTFHVRDDGWMGASLTYDGPRVIEPGQPLQLRYGLYVHAGLQTRGQLQSRWQAFAATEPPKSLIPVKK